MRSGDDLSETEVAKLTFELRAWLDGASERDLGILSHEPGIVRVWANVAEELAPAKVGELIELGLDAEEYMLAIPGSISREQLIEIVRHPDIVGVSPITGAQLGSIPDYPTDTRGGGCTHG